MTLAATPEVDPRFVDRPRQHGLDFLRALAIVLVVLHHGGNFGFTLPWNLDRFGWVGVDLFFLLSGYLIGGQLLVGLARGAPRLGRFYQRRFLRIVPVYFVVLAVYFGCPGWREFPDFPAPWKFVLSVQNIGLRAGTAFSHAWSLAVEDQFYLCLPWLLLWIWPRQWAGLWLPVGVVFAGMILRAYLVVHFRLADPDVPYREFMRWIYYPTWTRLDPLVCGVALAAIEQRRPVWWQHLLAAARWVWLPGIGLVSLGLHLSADVSLAGSFFEYPLIALGLSACFVGAVHPQLPLQRFPVPGAAFLASIAYSVYLTHKLVIHGVKGWCTHYGIAPNSAPAIVLLELVILLTGALLFLAIERPCLQLRNRLAA